MRLAKSEADISYDASFVGRSSSPAHFAVGIRFHPLVVELDVVEFDVIPDFTVNSSVGSAREPVRHEPRGEGGVRYDVRLG